MSFAGPPASTLSRSSTAMPNSRRHGRPAICSSRRWPSARPRSAVSVGSSGKLQSRRRWSAQTIFCLRAELPPSTASKGCRRSGRHLTLCWPRYASNLVRRNIPIDRKKTADPRYRLTIHHNPVADACRRLRSRPVLRCSWHRKSSVSLPVPMGIRGGMGSSRHRGKAPAGLVSASVPGAKPVPCWAGSARRYVCSLSNGMCGCNRGTAIRHPNRRRRYPCGRQREGARARRDAKSRRQDLGDRGHPIKAVDTAPFAREEIGPRSGPLNRPCNKPRCGGRLPNRPERASGDRICQLHPLFEADKSTHGFSSCHYDPSGLRAVSFQDPDPKRILQWYAV